MTPAGKLELLISLMNIPVVTNEIDPLTGEPKETGEFISLLTDQEALNLLKGKMIIDPKLIEEAEAQIAQRMGLNLEEIKNSIESWKNGANRAYPNLLTWKQIHWLIGRVEELERIQASLIRQERMAEALEDIRAECRFQYPKFTDYSEEVQKYRNSSNEFKTKLIKICDAALEE